MNIILVIIFAMIAVGAILYVRRVSPEAAERSYELWFRAAIGAGIIGLGILLLIMPWAAGAIAAFDFVSSSDFGVLTGADYVLGVIALLAGLALILHKETPE